MGYAYTKVYPRECAETQIDLLALLSELNRQSYPDEEWRDIEEFSGFYQVSNKGRVRSLPRMKRDKLGRIAVQIGCILSQLHEGPEGTYRKVILRICGHAYNRSVHRLVALAFVPNPDSTTYTQVNHIDGDPAHNEPSNLEWVTPKQNTAHAIRTGLFRPRIHPGMRGYVADTSGD